jgi:hypothetical protein
MAPEVTDADIQALLASENAEKQAREIGAWSADRWLEHITINEEGPIALGRKRGPKGAKAKAREYCAAVIKARAEKDPVEALRRLRIAHGLDPNTGERRRANGAE